MTIHKMEKDTLALAVACMTMFAMEQKEENNEKNDKIIHKIRQLEKDIADNFPSISAPVSELYENRQKDSQTEKGQSEEI